MAKQLLFYDSAVPVSKARHADLSIGEANFEFAANVNSVPLMAVEIPRAVRDYTIVFAGTDVITPVVLLGVENNSNVYVNAEGGWDAEYVPAFVRRYPFVFSMSEDESQFTLCIDESWKACQRDGEGRRLFDDQGERTEYLSQMLAFLEQYQAHFNRTKTFCAKLKELDLLEPMKADFKLADGKEHSLGGFMAVNREKLKNIPEASASELLKSDELELIFNHLLSMANLRSVADRASKRATKDATAEETPKKSSKAKKSK